MAKSRKRRGPIPRRKAPTRKRPSRKARPSSTRKSPRVTDRVIHRKPVPKRKAPTPKPKPTAKRTPTPVRKPTRKPIPKPKPTPKRIKPTSVLPVRASLRLEERTQWRKGGKLVAKGTRGAKPYTSIVQLNKQGRVVRTIEKETPHVILKTVVPSKIGDFEREGKYQGMIYMALIDASVTSKLHQPNVRRVEVLMRWQDERGKSTRIKLSLDLEHVRKRKQFPAALAGLILEALRDRGFRTNYTIELFKQARAKGLKYPITWDQWRKLKIARNIEIIVTIYTS